MTKLLLVEDSPTQAAQVTALFKAQHPDIAVDVVTTGAACLKELARASYRLILLDYVLPDRNGLELLAEIRKLGCTSPVIFVTGAGDEQIAVEAMKAGAADYVTKSSDFIRVLPVVVQQVLENEKLKTRLATAEERLQLIHRISLNVSLELSLEQLGKRLAEGIRQLTKSEAAAVVILHPQTQKIVVFSLDGFELDPTLQKDRPEEMGILGHFMNETGPVILTEPTRDSRFQKTPPHCPIIRTALVTPLLKNDKIMGGLLVCNPTDGSAYGPEEMQALLNLAAHASTAIENAHYVKRTELMAVTDSLTELYNHREFQKRLDEEVERAKRYERHLSLLMMDIDHFKSFNDTYGHPFGDTILKKISDLILSQIRNVDIASRYGGEEFTIILPETDIEGALWVAERIRSKIFETVFETGSEIRTQVTVSIGIACLSDVRDRVSFIAAADRALYIAKEAGRNQVCQYSSTFDKMVENQEASPDELRLGLLRNLAKSVDAKSPYMRGHSEEVARLTVQLADSLHLPGEESAGLRQAALLHNVGTANISGRILNKSTPLTSEEQKIIRAHPIVAEMLLKDSPHLHTIVPAVLYHHERFDGKGYPSGLAGEQIPYPARVLAVTSAYHAMISDRPYRKKRTPEEAVSELRKNAGFQFDPRIVETFIQMLDEKNHTASPEPKR